jgi:hypothetical protein
MTVSEPIQYKLATNSKQRSSVLVGEKTSFVEGVGVEPPRAV